MMKYICPMVLFVSVILFSCRESETARTLRFVDSIVESEPALALDTLNTIDVRGMRDEDKAYFALLYTTAQFKNLIRVDSDTLMRVAYEYYKDRDDGDRSLRANLYEAKINFNEQKHREAVPKALKAYGEAKALDNPLWKARTATLLSDIYLDVYNDLQAEKYTREAIENFERAGKEYNKYFAEVDLGYIFHFQGRDEESFNILDSLYRVARAEEPLDSIKLRYIIERYFDAAIEADCINEMDSTAIDYALSFISDFPFNGNLNQAFVAIARNENEKAYEYLDKAAAFSRVDGQTLYVIQGNFRNALAQEKYEEAVKWMDSILNCQNRIIRDVITESVAVAQSDYYNHEAEMNKARSERLHDSLMIVSLVAVIVVLLLLFGFLHYVYRRKADMEKAMGSLLVSRRQIEEIEADREALSDRLKGAQDRNEKLELELSEVKRKNEDEKSKLIKLAKERLSVINILCTEYFEFEESETSKKMILKNVHEEIKKFNVPENFKKIEEEVNLYMNNIMKTAREQCPFLSENDFRLLTLIYAQFNPRAICFLLGWRYKNFYLRKTRLRERILESGAPARELLVQPLLKS